MPTVDRSRLFHEAERLERLRDEIGFCREQMMELKIRIGRESYMEDICRGISRLLEELKEEEAILNQMSRVAIQAWERYGNCEERIMERYESGAPVRTGPVIGRSQVLVDEGFISKIIILLRE